MLFELFNFPFNYLQTLRIEPLTPNWWVDFLTLLHKSDKNQFRIITF